MKQILNKRKNAGFTLLELVVVVAVMGLISTMAMDVYTDNTNQTRYDLTKKRVEEIRYAIIGDDSRTLNGQTTISGYIADTGEVPTEIRQLILKEYCIGDPLYFTKNHCESGGETWKNQETEINWKGPYLKTSASEKITRTINGLEVVTNVSVFRDGWGRNLNNSNEDMKNYGWEFNENSGDISLQSYGLDRSQYSTSSDPSTATFEDDYPASGVRLVTTNQYASSPNDLSIEITNKSGATNTICLMWDGIETGNSGSQTILNNASYPKTINLPTMGFVNFTLDKDGDCDISDGQTISLPITSVVTHHSISLPEFEYTLN